MLEDFDEIAQQLGEKLRQRGLYLVTAESCTGGLLAATLTAIAGSSSWFERGFVTYSNAAKQSLLRVSPATLERFGAVSVQTAEAMAVGALLQSDANVSVAITGIAGPTGGTPDKPLGTVCFSFVSDGQQPVTECVQFGGQRKAVRLQSVQHAIEHLIFML